jgi:hypothetical protein
MQRISSSAVRWLRWQRMWFVALIIAALSLTIQLQGASLRCAIAALERHRSRLATSGGLPPRTDVVWSPAAPLSVRTHNDSVHVAVPGWLAGIVTNPFGRWIAAPFGSIDQVRLLGSNPEAISVLARCQSLREIELQRIRGGSQEVWQQLLTLPLQSVFAFDCDLPRNAISVLSQAGTITSLTISQQGTLDVQGLSRCRQLLHLQLFASAAAMDESLAAEVSPLHLLEHVMIDGAGEQTVAALATLPALESVVLRDCDARPDVVAAFAQLASLKTLVASRCPIDDGVLGRLAASRSLRRCYVQGETVTEAAVKAFREQRPDVELTLLSRLD